LLKLVIREKRAAFNERFVGTKARKQACMDKIAEFNTRLAEIQKELGMNDALTSYSLQEREASYQRRMFSHLAGFIVNPRCLSR
jgi:hypothetical protein